MKKIFFAAAAALLTLSACGEGGKTPANTGDNAAADTEVKVISNRIAYIDMDSLLGAYNMAIDLMADLEKQAKKAENELTSKGRGLEKEMNDFNEKNEKGLATRAQLQTMAEDLQRKRLDLMEREEKLRGELAEENQVMMNRIMHAVNTYIGQFNSDYGYAMILSTSGGVPILNADPSLNITSTVLKGLNDEYAKTLTQKKK